jgi:Photosynthesis affected mutant 68
MANAKSSQSKNGQKGSSGLPFEPKSKDKTAPKKAAPLPKVTRKSEQSVKSADAGIPQVVSRRMAKRMFIFSGIPTLLGLGSFPVSYAIFSSHLIELPNVVVLLISMGFFGLGVVGLTYGVLSASWDVENPGSALGVEEFKLNLGRMIENWKLARQRSEP